MYQRIVVPLDGSTTAEQALPQAERMARTFDVPIHLLAVVDLTQMPWYGQYGMSLEHTATEREVARERSTVADYLESVASRLRDAGLVARTELRRGRAAREIVAATGAGDLLVIASHGRSGVTRWLMGSVAEDVLRHASVPILLIKAPTPEAARVPVPAQEAVAFGS
ncbi:MAG: universal stress protein [Thermomicrobiales bacterium]|nr:universal stress protein [Thermomicrobiales bacterium]